MHHQVESHPPRYVQNRLTSRIASAREIRSQLLVLVHMVDVVDARTSRLPWLTADQIERRVAQREARLQDVELHKTVPTVLNELHDLRMVDADHRAYKISKLGLLHMWSHGTRLTRHNARDWERKDCA